MIPLTTRGVSLSILSPVSANSFTPNLGNVLRDNRHFLPNNRESLPLRGDGLALPTMMGPTRSFIPATIYCMV